MLSLLICLLIDISLYCAYSPPIAPFGLLKVSSIDACPTGLRSVEPLKITSVPDSARKLFAELSPITQRTASIIFDLPQPLGPTTPTRLLGNGTVVGSTNDLNPTNLICFKRNRSESGVLSAFIAIFILPV